MSSLRGALERTVKAVSVGKSAVPTSYGDLSRERKRASGPLERATLLYTEVGGGYDITSDFSGEEHPVVLNEVAALYEGIVSQMGERDDIQDTQGLARTAAAELQQRIDLDSMRREVERSDWPSPDTYVTEEVTPPVEGVEAR